MPKSRPPINIHVYGFDPPRGNRYSYHLDNGCWSTEDRMMPDAVQYNSDICVGADVFAYQNFPTTFSVMPVVNPAWGSRATANGMGANAGFYGSSDDPYGWDYLAYAAGDVESESVYDTGPRDGADTWFISSSDGYVNRVCPAIPGAVEWTLAFARPVKRANVG